MRYMLLMQGTQADWRAFCILPPGDIQGHLAFMRDLDRQLRASGELVREERLAGPERARVVQAQRGGAPRVTSAPFPEAKEFLAGCWVVDCDSSDRAIEIAARVSASPGREGVPLNVPVEVRPVMMEPGEEM